MSRISPESLWRYLMLAFLGTAASLAFLGRTESDKDLEPLMARVGEIETQILRHTGELNIRIEGLEKKIDVFSGLNNLHREETVPVPVPVPGAGVGKREEKLKGSSPYLWLSVLPNSVGRELVLRGLSPYDSPKTAGCVQKVCRRISSADSSYRASVSQNNEDYSEGLVSDAEFRLNQKRLQNEHDNLLLEAMNEFSTCLDSVE